MKRLLRPSSVVLVLIATGVIVWLVITSPSTSSPEPVSVSTDELEVAWLNSATSASSWRRFVQAVEDVFPGTKADKRTFPDESTSIPELRVQIPGSSQTMVFRWYKLTSQWKVDYWVRELLQRDPPPIAIIGGSNSDQAKTLVQEMKRSAKGLAPEQRPLLLITTATAEKFVSAEHVGQGPPRELHLMDVYKGRTFRFSFTNQQMCTALLHFIWTHEEFQTDWYPYYYVHWQDDAYSNDLSATFVTQLEDRHKTILSVVGHVGGLIPMGTPPITPWPIFHARNRTTATPVNVPWSEGLFDAPNRYEAEAASYVLDFLDRHPWQKRPLLLLSGQTKPARRFLRALERLSPMQARQFVVVSGDGISFNAIYRDSTESWPIQDLPFSLVSFAHHNPIDPKAGFGTKGEARNGTNDLLLSRHLVQALKESCQGSGSTPVQAKDVLERFRQLRLGPDGPVLEKEGKFFFTKEGNRHPRTGEHVIWLRPHFSGSRMDPKSRVLPRATLTVWTLNKDEQRWESQKSLTVHYNGPNQ